ncbi:hypothetical protein ACNVED_01720 [Legionella sp. D16C41]|uniref:hypothetical protein n=1 Tax=Legionella sp. D16C41 TaxID=3402688 RepID=UPI003AF7E91B
MPAHANLISDLKKITTSKSFDRVFKYINKKNYTKALLLLCQKCKNSDETRLRLVKALLNYKTELSIDINKQDVLGKSPILYALQHQNSHLFTLLKNAGANIEQKLSDGFTILDKHRYNVVQKILNNSEAKFKEKLTNLDTLFNKLPTKNNFKTDNENARYDQQRLEFILASINHLLTYHNMASDRRIPVAFTPDAIEANVVFDFTLVQARNHLEKISLTIRNLSGEFRERYKKLFGPAPFTWFTFEQFGGLVRIKDDNRYIFLPIPVSLNQPLENHPDVFLRLYNEFEDMEEFVENAVPSIISMDLPILKDFFEKILINHSQSQNNPISSISLTAIKAFTSHLGDNLTLLNLLNLFNYSEHEASNLYEKKQLSDRLSFLVNIPPEKGKEYRQRFDLTKKSGRHAALRRLQAIGELCTGKKLSKDITELDNTIDWNAFVTVRDGLCHPDERDNKYKIDLLLTNLPRLEKIVGEEFSDFQKKLTQIVKAREVEIGRYEHDSGKRWLQILERYVKATSVVAKESPKEEVTRRVPETEEQLFLEALIEKNAPQEIIVECHNIFAGEIPIPDKRRQGELLRYLPTRAENKERYKSLTAIFPKSDAIKTTEEERNRKRRELEEQAKQKELEKENKFLFFPTLRELARFFKQDPIAAHQLNPIKRIYAAIEALNNIEEFLFEEGYLLKEHPYKTLEEWDRYHLSHGRKKLAQQLELNRQLNDALEYNAGHLLQHLDRIQHYPEAKFCKYLNEDYEAIRTLRNYIEHGDPLNDPVGYDLKRYEKGELRQHTILKVIIELVFNLNPALHQIAELLKQAEVIENPKEEVATISDNEKQLKTNNVSSYSSSNTNYALQFFSKTPDDSNNTSAKTNVATLQ